MNKKEYKKGYDPRKIICKKCGKKDFDIDTGTNVQSVYNDGVCVQVNYIGLIPRIFCSNCHIEIIGEWLTVPWKRWKKESE